MPRNALSCTAFGVLLPVLAAGGAGASTQPLLSAHQLAGQPTPVLDGDLNDAAWQLAPVFDAFHEFEPRNGRPAPDTLRTTVQVLVDEQALVVGIRAWDADAGKRSGTLARRDKVAGDQDFVGVWIDPSGHGRAAQFVRVNIAGVISDGVYRADIDEEDFGPDYPVDAVVKLLPDGYSVELRWPLSSLRFPYADGKPWRAMIERSVPHAGGMKLLSAPLPSGALSYIAMQQEIAGMGDTVASVRDRSFLELKPELTLRRERETQGGARRSSGEASLGLDINLRPRADWVLNATLNPDFSQVEIDEPTSQGARRIALSLPEKRGFFLESADVLGLPLAAFYSRTVADPAWGVRATWRAADADASAMSLRDQEGGVVQRGNPYATGEYLQTGRTQASLARGRWHGDTLLGGAFASLRDYGSGGRNAVAGIDAQWQHGDADQGQHKVSTLLMRSSTTANFADDSGAQRAEARRGSYAWARYNYHSSGWVNEVLLESISPGFANDNGFVPQTGVLKTDIDLNRRHGEQHIELFGLDLYEFETHLGLHEIRTRGDALHGQASGQIVERKIQPGIWLFAPRQTRLFANLGFDQQRGRPDGALHNTPALHLGFASRPLPWLVNLAGELSLGRRLDIEADRVGGGGEALLEVGLRFALPRGWAAELDHRWNRAWVRGTLGHAAYADNGWRWLGVIHMGPRDSVRLLAQNTWSARRDDGVSTLDAWAERQLHRSVLYRHLWRHGRSMSLGFVKEKTPDPAVKNKAVTFKIQWET